MSLLDEIRKKKTDLKPTTTLVTTCDGHQYIEMTDSNREEKFSDKQGTRMGRPPNLTLRGSPVCHGYVVDNKPDLHVGAVSDHLLVGSADAAMDPIILERYKVTHVLTVAPLPNYIPPTQVKHKALDILDLPDTELTDYMDTAFAFINDAIDSDGCVLVHCNAGVSRSAAIAIAYLMKTNRITYDEAFSLVKQKRPAINPNIGFIIQLQNYEKQMCTKKESTVTRDT